MKQIVVAIMACALMFACTPEENNSGGNENPGDMTVHVTGISLDRTSVTIKEGESVTLVPTITPDNADNKNVAWSSSSEAVATVDNNGKVTGFKAGSATITATTEDGGKKATCALSVEANLAPSVTIEANHVSAISAVLAGKANLGSSVASDLKVGFQYSKSSGILPSNSTTVEATDADENYNYTTSITNLEPDTKYYFRSFVRQNGQDTYGETREFVTKEIESLLGTRDASGVEATSAVLNAKLDLTDIQYTNLIYGFLWGSSESALNTDFSCTEIKDNSISATLTNLSHKTQYWFKAYVTLDNQTFHGEVKTFTTDVVAVESVSLDKTEYTFNTIGNTLSLNATVLPADATDKSIEWSSDNVSVATVDQSGTVKAIGSGTATITAEAGGKTATCEITVYIPVESITLSQDEMSLLEGQSKTITATINPSDATDKTIQWLSDHPEIASVSDGTVSALSKGQANIIAYSGSIASSCIINVLNEDDLDLEKNVTVEASTSTGSASINGVSYTSRRYTITNNSLVAIVVYDIYAANCNYYSYPHSVGSSTFDLTETMGSVMSSYTLEAGETMYFRLYFKGYITPVATVWFKYNNKKYSVSSNPNANVSNAVDLGVSVKWAKFNLGASSPETPGDYFAWGETETKSNYSWSTYRFGTSASGPFSKYNSQSSYGTVDNKTQLDLNDDAAHVILSAKWRMPTAEEWVELLEQCTWKWTTQNGEIGYLVTGNNNNSIFLPVGGYMEGTTINANNSGYYASSSLYSDYPYRTWFLFFNSSEAKKHFGGRFYGRLIRPVSE